MISTLTLVLGSAVIVWVSRRSLLRPASHGFFRFFAFEAVLLLLVLAGPNWFDRPWSARQLVSWVLLTTSLVLVVWGVVLLRRRGGSAPADRSSPDFAWESTEHLVTSGVYRHIRHPMYASLLFLVWGAVLKSVSGVTLLVAGLATVALVATAKAEEAENLRRFGDPYAEYMGRTRRFVPFLF